MSWTKNNGVRHNIWKSKDGQLKRLNSVFCKVFILVLISRSLCCLTNCKEIINLRKTGVALGIHFNEPQPTGSNQTRHALSVAILVFLNGGRLAPIPSQNVTWKIGYKNSFFNG